MSDDPFAALRWAYAVPIAKASRKSVLTCLAFHANENGESFPSVRKLQDETSVEHKTVIEALADLVKWGAITDTGRRVGATGQIPVYRVNTGVKLPPEATEKATRGRVKHTQNWEGCKNETHPILDRNTPKIGTRNCQGTPRVTTSKTDNARVTRQANTHLPDPLISPDVTNHPLSGLNAATDPEDPEFDPVSPPDLQDALNPISGPAPKLGHVRVSESDTSPAAVERIGGAAGARKSARRSTRGTRLPDGWSPPPELVNWAVAELLPDGATCDQREAFLRWTHSETQNFCDWWKAKAGAEALKADWDATWRNWMRRAPDFAKGRLPWQSSAGRQATNGRPPRAVRPTIAEGAAQVTAEFDQMFADSENGVDIFGTSPPPQRPARKTHEQAMRDTRRDFEEMIVEGQYRVT